MAFLVFVIGFALIPFESLPVTISSGWNALAHVPFTISLLLLLLRNPSPFISYLLAAFRRFKLVVLWLGLASIFSYFIYSPPAFQVLIEEIVKLLLAISLAFQMAYFLDYKKYKISLVLNVLSFGYLASFGVGLARRLGFNLAFFSNAREGLVVGVGNNPFTFTEPSFISVHMYGIVLPLAFIVIRRFPESRGSLFGLFGIISLFFVYSVFNLWSVRYFVDTFLAGLILLVALVFYSKSFSFKRLLLNRPIRIVLSGFGLLLFVGLLITFLFPDSFSSVDFSRVLRRLDSLNLDPSAQLRLFRARSVIDNWLHDPLSFLIGAGFSNLCSLTKDNLSLDFAHLSSFAEYISLNQAGCVDIVYSMPLFLLGSFGLTGTALLYAAAFKRHLLLELLLVSYISLQFDSFAFYGISFYIWSLFSPTFGSTQRAVYLFAHLKPSV